MLKPMGKLRHEVLLEALWAHRVSRHSTTKVTPFELVYGQAAVLPIEVNLRACRVARQNDLSAKEYTNLMMDQLDETEDNRSKAMTKIEREKLQIAKAYNENVRGKSFQVGDLVWKTILPLKARDLKFGKWSPNWEGPYKVTGIVPGNAYFLETLEGRELPKVINGKYLKAYFPSVWQGA
jgi:hypothetical protein